MSPFEKFRFQFQIIQHRGLYHKQFANTTANHSLSNRLDNLLRKSLRLLKVSRRVEASAEIECMITLNQPRHLDFYITIRDRP